MLNTQIQTSTFKGSKYGSFPVRWKFPGDKTPSRQHLPEITGDARKTITHSLCYYGFPQNIDKKIDKLPSQEELNNLTSLGQHYISFTVYILKQMLAVGAIKPETAWMLFNWDFNNIQNQGVNKNNFEYMRNCFMLKVRSFVQESDLTQGKALVMFEFWARAGSAGLEKYEEYPQFKKELEFNPKEIEDSQLEEEYKKALWLEMRLMEDQVGIKGLNEELSIFEDGYGNDYGEYNPEKNKITATINMFNRRKIIYEPKSIDSTIKAEIGHWMFRFLNIRTPRMGWSIHRVVTELADRSNFHAILNGNLEDRSPQAKVFKTGGYYFTSRHKDSSFNNQEERFPTFPEEHPTKRAPLKDLTEEHVAAEYFDRLIRIKLFSQKGLLHLAPKPSSKAKVAIARKQLYRKIVLYISLLDLEGKIKNFSDLQKAIKKIDPEKIEEYYLNWREKAIKAFEQILRDGEETVEVKKNAAKAIGHLGNSSSLPTLLQGLEYYSQFNWDEDSMRIVKSIIEAIGFIENETAVAAIEKQLNNAEASVRSAAAKTLIKLKNLKKGSSEYKELYAYTLIIGKTSFDNCVKLGEQALSAMEKGLKDNNSYIRALAALTIIKIKKLESETDEYQKLIAYHLIQKREYKEAQKLGRNILPALKEEIKHNPYFINCEGVVPLLKKTIPPEKLSLLDERLNLFSLSNTRAAIAGVMINVRKLKPGTAEYKRLYAYILIDRWEEKKPSTQEVKNLGNDAIYALKSALNDSYAFRVEAAVNLLLEINREEAIQILEDHLLNGCGEKKSIVAKALKKARNTKKGSEEERRLTAFQLIEGLAVDSQRTIKRLQKLGKAAVPALRDTIQNSPGQYSVMRYASILKSIEKTSRYNLF
ncbi:hypothetical protein A2526_05660 [candidate division WOR-1 bacterium RIFOXYD2_FULL_36_8]|uniref:HEAT repeat domain-containing protein n=1 Tax=candidate division WOR-1 bacterium RIFOXYB2_FULL_36_35 TaxID=1802578 RepID=A0A1F4S313_UNCSA|nr:MAG: hypothetical protein A2230_07500 [candidate division WOR-1 bacterium RIFOXYA2_FULL_36_21]OGC14767.1 MAG: hypothetical protein A2290_08745 [candidate division WOR-1 bacterium RIFOXYB2_FULL_36_35]OGC15448.1 MAG: hypothetical protein A2282_07675 [candidate division WOR-1 bacterium RIFOXYA12_FULL_36_13]OGC37899.1 MAG: hypothetical protein A2526_05660 [candidate division WOR-1 bacterium RIFOXYD2_FULL_36_8]